MIRTRSKPLQAEDRACAAGRFSRYAPESERQSRTPHTGTNRVMDAIVDAWHSIEIPHSRVMLWDFNRKIREKLAGVRWGAEEVRSFAVMASGFQDDPRGFTEEVAFESRLGVFLSALVDGGDDKSYSIPLRHLDRRLDCLAYRNRKDVILEGDVGHSTCALMKGGSVTIEGDAGASMAKSMRRGTVHVNGNVDQECGDGMSGGLITVAGDAGHVLGNLLRGGKIIVSGRAADRAGWMMEGGEISISGDCGNSAGREMGGGILRISGSTEPWAGCQMKGGVLEIGGDAAGHLGYGMEGGAIFVKGKRIL